MLVIDWQTFGERVYVARRRLRLSQSDLAKQIGISRNYISMIERGIADPSYAIVARLSDYLGIHFPPERPMNVATKVAQASDIGNPPHPNAE